MTFAKGLGNGLAIGGVVTRADMMDSLTVSFISTFGGNPLATAGVKAALDYLVEHDLQSNALKLGNYLLEGLRGFARDCPLISEVRGVVSSKALVRCQTANHQPETGGCEAVFGRG